jgi:hypothetical protein
MVTKRAPFGVFGTLSKTVPAFHGHDGRGIVYLIPILILNLIVAVGKVGFVVEYLSKVRPHLLVQ